ncbi:MAG: Holliday junction DNA helicase RuvA [Candidatus Midichloriaceae bacterium]|jgi:Holliday junction DNA helicase RuvA
MIGKLTGIISVILDDSIILDVNGVGYIVFCHDKMKSDYTIGDKKSMLTQTIIKENDISIFGFNSALEKDLFTHLLTIQGVGAKLSHTIIGSISMKEIFQSIHSNDVKKFLNISGVGAKLANRLLNELKNKKFINKLCNIPSIEGNSDLSEKGNSIISDACSALTNLGYNEITVNKVLSNIISSDKDIDLENLIKLSIKELSS